MLPAAAQAVDGAHRHGTPAAILRPADLPAGSAAPTVAPGTSAASARPPVNVMQREGGSGAAAGQQTQQQSAVTGRRATAPAETEGLNSETLTLRLQSTPAGAGSDNRYGLLSSPSNLGQHPVLGSVQEQTAGNMRGSVPPTATMSVPSHRGPQWSRTALTSTPGPTTSTIRTAHRTTVTPQTTGRSWGDSRPVVHAAGGDVQDRADNNALTANRRRRQLIVNNESGGGSIYAGSFDNANQDDNETLFLANIEGSEQRHAELERRVDGMQAEMGALNTRMGTISSHMDEGFGRLTALIQVAMGLQTAPAAAAPPARTDISPVVSTSKSGEQELQTPFDAPRSAFKPTSPPRTPFAVQEDRQTTSAA